MEKKSYTIHKKKLRGLQTGWIQCGSENSEAPLLFFFHGCPDRPTAWSHQIDYFKKNHLIIAPFARGILPSVPTKESSRYALDSIVQDNLEILKTVDPEGVRKIILMGHDIGAIHAMWFAKVLGDRLKGLVLINGPSLELMVHKLSNPLQVMKSWYIGFFQIPLVSDVLIKMLDKKMTKLAYKMGGLPNDGIDFSAEALLPFLPHYRSSARELFYGIFRKNSKTEVPTLILWSSADAFLEIPSRNMIEKCFTQATIRILEGHHWIHQEIPDRVNQLMAQFIEGV